MDSDLNSINCNNEKGVIAVAIPTIIEGSDSVHMTD